jgi:hypothetical protein
MLDSFFNQNAAFTDQKNYFLISGSGYYMIVLQNTFTRDNGNEQDKTNWKNS